MSAASCARKGCWRPGGRCSRISATANWSRLTRSASACCLISSARSLMSAFISPPHHTIFRPARSARFSSSIWSAPRSRHGSAGRDRKSTRLNSSHTEIYTLSLHDALPICFHLAAAPYNLSSSALGAIFVVYLVGAALSPWIGWARSEEHTSELQSHRDLHSFPTRRSSDLLSSRRRTIQSFVQRARRDFRRLSGRRRALAMDRLG